MDSGIVKGCGDLCKIQIVFPDHLFTFLELDSPDILTGRNLQIFMEQGRQVAGADIHHPGNQGYRQFFPDMGADELLSLTNNLIITVNRIGCLQFITGWRTGFPQQNQQQLIQKRNNQCSARI